MDSDLATAVKIAHKKLRLREQNSKEAKEIESQFGLSSVASKVMAARGFKANEDLKHYLNPTLKEGLPEPGGLKNIEQAALIIKEAIEKGEQIAICCDFDVDGLSGGSLVAHFIRACGGKVQVFVPDRFSEGYGLHESTVRQIASEGFAVLLTIDFGTSNVHEIAVAKKLGLKTIVIDHHELSPELPPCDAFVNHHQEGCGFAGKILCAAGLGWYLLVMLRQVFPAAKSLSAREYLDIAALGTICDMVPLIGANRVIAKRGLELLSTTTRPGLVALKNIIGMRGDLSCYHVSFGIGPRLNAAGRMVHGNQVVELLTTTDSRAAQKIAEKLDRLNKQRQETEARIKERAVTQCKSAEKMPAGLVVWDPSYHTGVIGIVAQRLVEDFYRPSVVLGMDKEGIYKGSVRGVPGFNVVSALSACSKYLLKFGGHENAGGLSVEAAKVEDFSKAFIDQCSAALATIERDPIATADTEIVLPELDLRLINELKGFSPFGVGNPGPQLLVKNLLVRDVKVLKSAHIKATLTDGHRFISGLLWRQTSHPALSPGKSVNMIFKPEANSYNGSAELQANIQAVESA